MTPDQARLLLTTVRGSSLEAYFTVAISLGLRPGEALGLQWSDINWSARTLTVRQQLPRNAEGKLTLANLKTERSRRTIHLPSVTIRALMQHRAQQLEDQQQAAQWEDNDLVFSTKGARGNTVGGRPLQQRNVYRELQGHLQMAGLPRQRLYDLRHLAASLLIAQGASLREVMEVLGHSQYTLTADTYVHIYDEMGRANADRIDQWYGDPAISSAAGEEGSSTTLEEW